MPLRILGPTPCSIVKVNEKYRYKLTVKCRGDKAFRELMRRVLAQYEQEKLPAKASVILDMHSDGDL